MTAKKTHSFQSEVKQLLHLMIHSLYFNKEVFLRELISNAADAVDKLRFHSLSNPDLYGKNDELDVRIAADEKNNTITIMDNGIGMNRTEVIENLGTIAKSGTKTFLNSVGENKKKNSQLIGQFGVGFYSVFMVAKKVTVRTRSVDESPEKGVFWESQGEGEYSLSDTFKQDRGTEITLYLRESQKEFLQEWRIRDIINKYSEYVPLPVKIKKTENKKISWEQVNKAEALWTKNKSEIQDKEYASFYRHISHDSTDPLLWSHHRVEGKSEYTALLYIPSQTPWNMWNRDYKHGLKLYVQRVFIMDNAEKFLPNYLRFVKGIIDSSDLPLNVSRETLQDNSFTRSIRNSLTKKILSVLEKLSKNNCKQYENFWKQFGLVIKEGPAEDSANQKTIAKLLRFSSTYCESDHQNISLTQYVSRMKEKQEKIYYITADGYHAAKNSPHLELLNKKNIEVLLLFDRIDEWMMSYLTEFEGKPFQPVSKIDESLEKIAEDSLSKDNIKNSQQLLGSFIEKIKKLLGNRVKEVKLTNRLTNTPAVVTTDKGEMSTQMKKLLSAAGQNIPQIKYIFEINPNHKLVKLISGMEDTVQFEEGMEVLFDQALLAECGTLDNPHQFIKRVNQLIYKNNI